MHWADASTRDLAVALSRTARGRLLFVLSVRNDDLHRRHPARKALAEIGRVPGGRRVEPRPPGPGQHRRHRGVGLGNTTRSGAGPVPCWSVRRATRSTPRRSSPPDPESMSLTSCPTCSWPGSTRWPKARVSSCGPHPWTARAWTSTRSPRSRASTTVRLDAFLRDLLDANVLRHAGRHTGVPARTAARGRVRRPAPRRAHPAPRRARRASSRPGPTRIRTPGLATAEPAGLPLVRRARPASCPGSSVRAGQAARR